MMNLACDALCIEKAADHAGGIIGRAGVAEVSVVGEVGVLIGEVPCSSCVLTSYSQF